MAIELMLPQPLLYYRQTLAGMTPTTYFCDLDYLFALSKGKPKMPYTTREYERRGQAWHYPPAGSESPSDGDIPYGDLNAHPARFPPDLARAYPKRDNPRPFND